MTEIRWEDPPMQKTGAPKGVWAERLAPLVAHPKRWAMVYVGPTKGAASKLQQTLSRRELLMPPGRWEFTVRTTGGEFRVYGRYLGPDEDGAS